MLYFTRRHTDYTLNNYVIHAPAVVKDLGVTIDKDLMFNMHINSIAHRAHYRAYAINKCFLSRDRSTLLRAASPVWSPQSAGLIKTIESNQRRFTASLPGCKHLTYTERLKLLI